MIRALRKLQPRNPLLAVLFWMLLLVVAVAVLFAAFFVLNEWFDLTPFDSPRL